MQFDLNTVWFGLVGVLLAGYAILDGFDLGVGAIHLLVKGDRFLTRSHSIDRLNTPDSLASRASILLRNANTASQTLGELRFEGLEVVVALHIFRHNFRALEFIDSVLGSVVDHRVGMGQTNDALLDNLAKHLKITDFIT